MLCCGLQSHLPAGHNVHAEAPETEYCPVAHDPVQVADVSPVVDPYSPAGQLLHAPAPPVLYCPATHTAAVAVVDPATQKYPALHGAVQVEDV